MIGRDRRGIARIELCRRHTVEVADAVEDLVGKLQTVSEKPIVAKEARPEAEAAAEV